MLPHDAQCALRHAARARRRIRRRTRVLTVVLLVLLARLSIDVAIHQGWLTDAFTAMDIWFDVLLYGFAVLLIAALSARWPKETPGRAARRVDAVLPQLGESLDALVYLEPRREEPFVASYAKRISRRVARVLRESRMPHPYARERRRSRALLAACALSLLGAIQLERRLDPWGQLEDTRLAELADPVDALELPESVTPEVVSEWGEVRITEPGRDLRVTKVDVVPLEIEAATSGELVRALWSTARSGEDDVSHELPEPGDPHHALYTPHLYVDELRLSDWDLVAYHASASTARGQELSSRIYFLEIRPFREEILKLGEGDTGRQKAFALLGEISGLIDRQKHVVRETHHHLHQPRQTAGAQRSDRGKLGRAEAAVLEASEHLYARVAAEMENLPVAEVLDHLALAQDDLTGAVAALRAPDGEPLPPQQAALRNLIATRKAFHKSLSEGGSDESGGAEGDEPMGPIAGLDDQLREMVELRDERAAVREEVRLVLEAQRRLAESVEQASHGEGPAHADEQRALHDTLGDLAELHPRPFARSRAALEASLDAVAGALDDLESGRTAGASQRRAVQRLGALHESLEADARRGDLAAAYDLRNELEETRERLGSLESEPSSLTGDELQALTEDARSAAQALDQAVPGGLPGLGMLESALAALEGAPGDVARSRAAGDARRALEAIEADLDRRAPELVRQLRKHNPLEESPEEALDDALRQLRGLADDGVALELDAEEREGTRRDILDGLRPGLVRLYGTSEARSMLALVETGLSGEGFDPARLRELVSRIESRRVEIREAEQREEDQRTLVHRDPTRLAPGYRRRVEEYFRRLSER